MNIINTKNSQFELFPNSEKSKSQLKDKKALLFKDLTLSLENIIVLVIILIMFAVISFSFGVERGREIALKPNPKDNINNTLEKQTVPLEQKENVVITIEETKAQKNEAGDNVRPIKKNEEVIELPVQQAIPEPYFTIQVASFKTMQNAEKEAVALKEKGYEIFVMPKGSYSIVCVGKFAQRGEAKKFSMKLRDRYSDCLIRRL